MCIEITNGSFFSGIGGYEIGFEEIGIKTEWFIENEPYAREILEKRFPGTKIYGDIKEINFEELSKVDIFTGGFPCQDISNAGKRAGIEGSRSSLWKYYFKAIRILRPKVVCIENVSALLKRGLNVVLADLASLGYDAEWHCISASSVGAPHRRDRIFIIAYSDESWLQKLEVLRQSNDLADSKLCRCLHRQVEKQSTERREYALSNTCTESKDVSNTNKERRDYRKHNWKERRLQVVKEWCFKKDKPEWCRWEYRSWEICKILSNAECKRSSEQRESRESLYQEENRERETNRFNDDGIWATEPSLGRVADGISNRVDRIKCLGNAIVPQLGKVIAETIINEQTEVSKEE